MPSFNALPLISFTFFLLLTIVSTCSAHPTNEEDFIKCFTLHSTNSTSNSQVIFTKANSSYTPILRFELNNLRFDKPEIPKPQIIVTPQHESQVQTVVLCAKKHGFELRIRSGGHSFEGHSYISRVPFVLLDMINFRSIDVDVKSESAWVGVGATNGELYYAIGQKSDRLGFPSGTWGNVGIGGLISGGGYGMLRRKYGLAADNVLDARLVDVNGRILDRKSMGEDLFWAIRGGGGGSFGVILYWKVKLVRVPKVVTVFRIERTLEQNGTQLLKRWQAVAPYYEKDLDIRCIVQTGLSNSSTRADKKTIQLRFESLYLGDRNSLLSIIDKTYPELGLRRDDCFEVSWFQSCLFFSNFTINTNPNVLLNRTALSRYPFKGNSDYTYKPIPEEGIKGIWDMLFKLDTGAAFMQFISYGGRMNEISESAIPFPHRAGTLYKTNTVMYTDANEAKRLEWMKSLNRFFAPYVSNNPRAAYVNYLDFDFGINNARGPITYAQASKWGKRYFKGNFDRLVQVKTRVDPHNFFRHEQSIPSLWHSTKNPLDASY